ncbi:hypothetical protein [Microcystis phage Mwe-JY08]
MADSVVAFTGGLGAVDPRKPYADLVAEIEHLLARAKSGELRALAYASVDAYGNTGSGWEGEPGTLIPLAASVLLLQHRYAHAALQDD